MRKRPASPYLIEGAHFMANPQMPFMDINQLMEQFKIPASISAR